MQPDTFDQPIVPCDWTTHQAHAVVEFLDALADRIWARYGFAITSERYPFPGPGARAQQLALPFPSLPEHQATVDEEDLPW